MVTIAKIFFYETRAINIDLFYLPSAFFKFEEIFGKIYNHVARGNRDNKVLRLNRSTCTLHLICIDASYVNTKILLSLSTVKNVFAMPFSSRRLQHGKISYLT